MTEVGIECNGATFYCHFKKIHTRYSSLKEIFFLQISVSKTANCIIVDIVKYLMLLPILCLFIFH